MQMRKHIDIYIILFCGILSQAVFYLVGGTFDAGRFSHRIIWMQQLLDVSLLQNRLVESIWYMHMQPPLFNVYVGVILKIFPVSYQFIIELNYILLSLVLAVIMYKLMRLMNVSRPLGLAATIIYQIGPADIVFRNWFFYTYPVMTILVLAAYFLYLYVQRRTNIYGMVFITLLTILMFTRATYHLIWYLLIISGLMIIKVLISRKLIVFAIAPILMATLWMGKNYYLFGQFAMSSLLGWNVSRVSTDFLTAEEKQALINEGELSLLSKIGAFHGIESYQEYLLESNSYWHPAESLNRQKKSNLAGNYNYINYIPVLRQFNRDAFAVITHRPVAYLRGITQSLILFFTPSWNIDLPEQGPIISRYFRYWAYLGGSLLPAETADPSEFPDLILNPWYNIGRVCWLVVILYALSIGTVITRLPAIKEIMKYELPKVITMSFMAFNISYVSITGIILEFGENSRFRAETIPLTIVCGIVLLQLLANKPKTAIKSGKSEGLIEPRGLPEGK